VDSKFQILFKKWNISLFKYLHSCNNEKNNWILGNTDKVRTNWNDSDFHGEIDNLIINFKVTDFKGNYASVSLTLYIPQKPDGKFKVCVSASSKIVNLKDGNFVYNDFEEAMNNFKDIKNTFDYWAEQVNPMA